MKSPNNIPLILSMLGILFLGILIGKALPSKDSGDPHQESKGSTWTCSMHPQVQLPKPGKCPICAIQLKKGAAMDHSSRVLSMSESAKALAEIQTTAVGKEFPEMEVRLVGKVDFDETREKSLTARFPARIEKLFVNYTGIPVKTGEHLAVVYSPDLLSAQREFLTAHKSNPESSIARAAREKLRLWDLLPEQIEEILEKGEASDQFVLKAPTSGIVVSKNVKEGDYVNTGQPLFRIVDLSVLWVYLDAFESDLPWLRYGQGVDFTVEAIPGETFHGQIAFIEPELNRKTRTASVRVTIPDPDLRLKPGMFVRGIVKSRLAGQGKVYAPELAGKWISPMHPEIISDEPGICNVCGMALVPVDTLGYFDTKVEEAPLIIPASAVLRTGKRAVVYVEKKGADNPTYYGKEVVLGPKAGDFFIVKEGLSEADKVVTNGAFKIDSALQIQAHPSMMNPPPVSSDHPNSLPLLPLSTELAAKVWKSYLSLQAALVEDDLEKSKAQVDAMMEITGHEGDLPDLLHKMLEADTLDALRKPHFEILSNAMISVAKSSPNSFQGDLFIMHCPMVHGKYGADWLQGDDKLLNPYFGARMLRCGKIKENLKSPYGGHKEHAH
jgi:Cu(I)/Ag(I) efflux system membrane fusion protein